MVYGVVGVSVPVMVYLVGQEWVLAGEFSLVVATGFDTHLQDVQYILAEGELWV
jgi:hypothetical protein